jgi:hypothetical protein
MSEQHVSKYRLDQLAKELEGKWYHQVVTDGRSEYKRIVIEYGHQRKG